MMRFDRARWAPWIFAAKTSGAALIALLVAFTFNLDQPQWTLLTVFIVASPQRDGLILAKSFYRIIGTVMGAAVALLFVAMFAQERVLFLGALAVWVGLCTFGSQYARNLADYSFVLSGYTVAIVGIAGALDPPNAFYIATARVTEISVGILVTATVSHLILPYSFAASLWQTLSLARKDLASCVVGLLSGADIQLLRAKFLGEAITLENLSDSAIFEDPELRKRRSHLRRVELALIRVAGTMQPLCRHLGELAQKTAWTRGTIEQVVAATKTWDATPRDTAGFAEHLRLAGASLPSVQQICLDRCLPEEEVLGRVALTGSLREFLTALGAYATAYQDLIVGQPPPAERVSFARSNDAVSAAWTGLRAVVAVMLASWFWIITAWPTGSSAATLAAVATARLATMGHAVPIARAGAFIFALAAVPAFIAIEILLPLASDFTMFALVVAPMVFACALLIAHERTMLIGFFSGLLFAAVGLFQNTMVYDAVGLINISMAAVFAALVALVMWAIVAPETPEAAHRRYARPVRRALERITAPCLKIGPVEFEAGMTEAFDHLRSHVRSDQPRELVTFDAGIALLDAGRELIRARQCQSSSSEGAVPRIMVPQFVRHRAEAWLTAMRHTTNATITRCIADLRNGSVATNQVQMVTARMIAAVNLREELENGRPLILNKSDDGAKYAA